MLLEVDKLKEHSHMIEDIEKASLRMVTQAIYDFRYEAIKIFSEEGDLKSDIGEDITREALDNMGMHRIPVRLFGKIDYKRACYLFSPEYAVRQALFVDSKAEKIEGQNSATIQTSQTSIVIKQLKSGKTTDEKGKLPTILTAFDKMFLTTTIFVKYNYDEPKVDKYTLHSIVIACLPNGILQDVYNPTPENNIWLVGRHSHQRGEEFMVRISFAKLRKKSPWRVQTITLLPQEIFSWVN